MVRHAFARGKVGVQQYTDWGYAMHGAWPYRHGRYGMWCGAPVTYTDVNQYTEGTLVLDFVDRKTGKLVFRGVGRGTIGDPGTNAAKVAEAVRQITADYPGAGG